MSSEKTSFSRKKSKIYAKKSKKKRFDLVSRRFSGAVGMANDGTLWKAGGFDLISVQNTRRKSAPGPVTAPGAVCPG